MKIVLFFIDGLGLGSNNKKENPLLKYMKFLNKFFGEKCFYIKNTPIINNYGFIKPIDALLNIKGLPQSATGQTTLFTGVNAAEVLGYHLTATPNEKLKNIIYEKSILKQIKDLGFKVTGANAYTKEYLENVEKELAPLSASSYTILAANENFRLFDKLKIGKAVFMDITNEILIKRGYKIKKISPKKASANLLNIVKEYDFVLYEYFLTDYFGHGKGSIKDVKKILKNINNFIKHFVLNMNSNTTLIITSDHGNIENIKVKPHTENPVPLIVISKKKKIIDFLYNNIESIVDVTPQIVNLFKLHRV